MIRQVLLVLGTTAVLASLTSVANAQSASPSSPENGSVTLSGQSLRAVENRSINDDFRTFFNATSQEGHNSAQTNGGRGTTSGSNASTNQGVNVVFGDTLNSDTPFTFSNSGDVGDSERVKVQLQVGQ